MKPQVSVTGKFIDKCTPVKLSRNATVPYNNIDVCIRSGYTRPEYRGNSFRSAGDSRTAVMFMSELLRGMQTSGREFVDPKN